MQRLVFIAMLVSSTPALADDAAPAPASLSFQYSGLKVSRTRTEYSGAVESQRKITSLLSGDLADSYLYATINGKLNIYFYPFQDLNAQVSVGYMLTDNLELGIDIGLNSTKVDNPRNEVSSDALGGFTTWTVPLTGMSLENVFGIDFSSIKSTSIDSTSGAEDTSKVTGTYMKVSSLLVIPIAKNAYYVGGIWISRDHARNHTIDTTRQSTQLGLMLAGLRIAVE